MLHMAVHTDQIEVFMIVTCQDNSVKCWQQDTPSHWHLKWSSHSSFIADNCKLENVVGLSPTNLLFLRQQNATIKSVRFRPQDQPSRKPVHLASANNDTKELQNHPLDLDTPTPDGDLPVHLAAIYGASAVLLFLQTHNFSYFLTRNKFGKLAREWSQKEDPMWNILPYDDPSNLLQTHLHWAALEGRVNLIQNVLLLNPACVNAKDVQGNTPLHFASQEGFSEVVELLCKLGANPDVENVMGQTSVHLAVRGNHITVVKVLHLYQANLEFRDKSDATSLWSATKQQSEEVGKTPLMIAAEYGYWDIIHYLVEHGFNSNYDHWVFVKSLKENLTTAEYLLQKGWDVNRKDEEGNVALVYACRSEDKKGISLLLKWGADINSRNKSGETVLTICKRDNYLGDVIQFLKENDSPRGRGECCPVSQRKRCPR